MPVEQNKVRVGTMTKLQLKLSSIIKWQDYGALFGNCYIQISLDLLDNESIIPVTTSSLIFGAHPHIQHTCSYSDFPSPSNYVEVSEESWTKCHLDL